MLTQEETEKRMKEWDNLFLVQLSKHINLELKGTYFDYIMGKCNMQEAHYKEEYKGHIIDILLSGRYYSDQWFVSLPAFRIKSKKCTRLRTAIRHIYDCVSYAKNKIDETIEAENNTKKYREMFTKIFNPESISVKNREIVLYFKDHKYVMFNITNEGTIKISKISEFAYFTLEQFKEIVNMMNNNK